MEMFQDQLLPRIKEIFEEKIKKYRTEVVEFKVEILGEIQDLREEVTATLHQYERASKRFDRVEKHVGLPALDF